MHYDVDPAEPTADGIGDGGASFRRGYIGYKEMSGVGRFSGRDRAVVRTVAPASRSAATTA
jgi:hypothetical protein